MALVDVIAGLRTGFALKPVTLSDALTVFDAAVFLVALVRGWFSLSSSEWS